MVARKRRKSVCKHCDDRRAVLSQSDAIKAAGHAMKGIAEVGGIKKKDWGRDDLEER